MEWSDQRWASLFWAGRRIARRGWGGGAPGHVAVAHRAGDLRAHCRAGCDAWRWRRCVRGRAPRRCI